MGEKFLRWALGIDNLKGIFIGRFIIGLVLFIYGFTIFFINSIEDQWLKISISVAFWGLGLMFILDGQSVLREYFKRNEVLNQDKYGKENLFLFLLKLFVFIGTILFFSKFYYSENPSFYPIIIYILVLTILIFFYKNISHFEISKDKILVKMKEDKLEEHQDIEQKKLIYNFKIEKENKK